MTYLKISVILFLPVLASCSVSTVDLENWLFRDLDFSTACSTNYYQELLGDYDGQISFADDKGLSCAWEVEIQVSSVGLPNNTFSVCELTFNMASTGATDGCADVGTGGQLIDMLAASPEMWDSPPYPVDIFAQVPTEIPATAVHPIGVSGVPTSQFTLTFDGLGNITLPESSTEYTGVLVKR